MCAPEETLARIQPLMKAAGIARSADITGLDRLGIPVTLALRPNARLIVGATGKGPDLVTAEVSGLMEAIEVHHAEYAEDAELALTIASYDELVDAGVNVVAESELPLARGGTFSRRWRYAWTSGFDLVRQIETAVPYLYVHVARDFLPVEQADPLTAQWIGGSNGLASGNSTLEAISSALYEVIERDAMAIWLSAETAGRPVPIVDLAEQAVGETAELVERCARADLRLDVSDFTSDLGVPTYCATLLDERPGGFSQPAAGWGTHLDPQIAMVRAITEAAQSRVVVIAGSRDDVFNADRHLLLHRQAFTYAGPRAPVRESTAGATFEDDVRQLLDRLVAHGLDRVIVVDLKRQPFNIDVVKVWVPGLEEYCKVSQYSRGARARYWADHVPADAVNS
ncbi:MAG: YcaO-like family protein [bacterium]|nr:YcaO-like family protein [bacterium]